MDNVYTLLKSRYISAFGHLLWMLMLTKDRAARLKYFASHPNQLVRNVVWRLPRTRSDQNHIFVVGAPRSGTTLMKLILSVHPNLKGPGYETGIFMYKNIFDFKFTGFTKDEIDQIIHRSRDIVQFFDGFAIANLQKLGGERFVEKTPPHVLKLDFLLTHFPNAHVVNIYRDGRDCYCSAQHHPNVVQGRSVKRYATYWKKCIQARLNVGKSDRVFDVKYEELTANPAKHVADVMAFLGEEYDPRQIDPTYYSQNKSINSKKAYLEKLAQPIKTASQGRWKTELSSDDVEQFNQIAGDELRLLNYL